ncbi:MAG: 2-oxoglutarate dehydrogenase E1 component [Cyanobacteria bacterium PR.023]|nr:2-oxoglutarate dehydrogenase E1 component [Cyanobacteria bacterium PR.023]
MNNVSMEKFRATSGLHGHNAPYLEELYEQFLANPQSVTREWQQFFASLTTLEFVDGQLVSKAGAQQNADTVKNLLQQLAVCQLIEAYRIGGVRKAKIDPLERKAISQPKCLDLASYNLEGSEAELSQEKFLPGNLPISGEASLAQIVSTLEQIYCGTVGLEYMHISNQEQRLWLQGRFEDLPGRNSFASETKRRILEKLTAAENLERYLHTRYVGQKRFSLEGGETFIAALDYLINEAAAQGVNELVMGMAHRGRLNVLVNVLGKLPSDLYGEFEGATPPEGTLPAGDVKYHKGFSSNIDTASGAIHVALAFNPSHLEIVNPVVVGSVRARQERKATNNALAVLVHGDAAFAGQGVNMETFELSRTRHYGIRGTVHIVINNQIGFTTSDIRDARSTLYCTDLAKMVEAPVFHVNADDPEAVLYAVKLALEYRMAYGEDVVIDLVCFRRRGHNEADEPKVTQPLMYQAIDKHPGTRALYAQKLIAEGLLSSAESEKMVSDYVAMLQAGTSVVKEVIDKNKGMVDWSRFAHSHLGEEVITAVDKETVMSLGLTLSHPPENFRLLPSMQKVLNNRKLMSSGEMPFDWAMAENLAYATLLTRAGQKQVGEKQFSVRISGEDCGRGTFFQRLAVFHDQDREHWDDGCFIPLTQLSPEQGKFAVIDSPLSEEAVLAFEYGYATTDPDTLVIWEAQFGDFANGAQVVIDQFITSGEVKWGRFCGLTMFLPHGYEGQGPEHSSARPERYLQLCADDNIQVVVPSTPAQMFHLLRRQMLRSVRKPLIVMTPKSLLRNAASTSSLDDLATGKFQTVIGDKKQTAETRQLVRRVIACCGKIYFDLVAEAAKRSITDVAIIRIEELYPLPAEAIKAELKLYPNADTMLWAQDEPKNQGYWSYLLEPLSALVEQSLPGAARLRYVGRPAAASPAVGYHGLHVSQQAELLESALVG